MAIPQSSRAQRCDTVMMYRSLLMFVMSYSRLFTECAYLSISAAVTCCHLLFRCGGCLFVCLFFALQQPGYKFTSPDISDNLKRLGPGVKMKRCKVCTGPCCTPALTAETVRVWVPTLLASVLCCLCTTQRSSVCLKMDHSGEGKQTASSVCTCSSLQLQLVSRCSLFVLLYLCL